MISNVHDLSKWFHALYEGNHLSDSIISTAFQRQEIGRTLGGWKWNTVFGTAVLEIGGSTDLGYTAKIQYYPDSEILIVLLFNGYTDQYGNRTHHVT